MLDKSDYRFRDLHRTLDTVSSDLHRQGIGATRKSAGIILPEEEDLLWAKGLLGTSSPKVLQHTIFFYIGLQFVLRGIQEQHDLLISQLVRFPPDQTVYSENVYYKYTEYISKNNQHRFKDANVKNKEVRAYALPGSERCLVTMLDTYLAKLPSGSSYLYMRPLENFPKDPAKPWYTRQRVGVNKLKEIVSELFGKSGLEVHYTNHSLRATAVTRMFNSGVPEKIIGEKSGHRSLEALRSYAHTSMEQEKAAGEVIANPKKNLFPDEKPKVTEESKAPKLDEVESKAPKLDQRFLFPNPGFSGNMSNCTINLNINYAK